MGKVKRDIIRIANPRDRKTTFKKRLDGLLKKMHELAILCDQDIFCFVRDHVTQRVIMFSSSGEEFYPHYSMIKQEDKKGPADVQHHYLKKQVKISGPRPQVIKAHNSDASRDMPSHNTKAPPPFNHVMYSTLMYQVSSCQEALRALRMESQRPAAACLPLSIAAH